LSFGTFIEPTWFSNAFLKRPIFNNAILTWVKTCLKIGLKTEVSVRTTQHWQQPCTKERNKEKTKLNIHYHNQLIRKNISSNVFTIYQG
jgi:hypothetical protein